MTVARLGPPARRLGTPTRTPQRRFQVTYSMQGLISLGLNLNHAMVMSMWRAAARCHRLSGGAASGLTQLEATQRLLLIVLR
jgi:hypothetical protein